MEKIYQYAVKMKEQEKSKATIQKYLHILNTMLLYIEETALTKERLLEWKQKLSEQYKAAGVNVRIAAVNGFLKFLGYQELLMKPLKIQKRVFAEKNRELTKVEYFRLVSMAKTRGKERLALMIQTICATGIRISELQYITVDAVYTGRADIRNKGKCRTILLPGKLCHLLKKYLKKQKRTEGAVFVTRNGKPLDRSNIWREMKNLAKDADVEKTKVFPHNLRHLFARTYYSQEKDLSRLADLLGHSNVNTTRIYTMESGTIHRQQLERMDLLTTE